MIGSISSVITGTGSYIPTNRIENKKFVETEFFDSAGNKLQKPGDYIVDKFEEITTIAERRYVDDDLNTSDIAFFAAKEAISSSGIDQEDLDYIIVAHNFGDVRKDSNRSDLVPTIAARVKHKLGIINPDTVAYDLPFGCPGWVQAMIQANYYLKSGDASRILVIGAETLSRIYDPHDRDGMIYADGAGAVVIEAKTEKEPKGILAHKTRSDTLEYSQMLYMDGSDNPDYSNPEDLFLKMHGRKLYQYAIQTVPKSIKACLEKADIDINEVKHILIHQANGKMDDAIIQRLFGLYGIKELPEHIMPMTVSWLGNSSVATVPTLMDLISRGEMEGYSIEPDDIIVFASVGAGMNVNAIVYRA